VDVIQECILPLVRTFFTGLRLPLDDISVPNPKIDSVLSQPVKKIFLRFVVFDRPGDF